VTWALTSPPATVGTAFQLGVLAVGVSPTDVGTDSSVAGRQCLWWTSPWSDVVDLVEKVAAFTARRNLGRLLSVTTTFS